MGIGTLISAFVGSWLAGYLRKKGENLATHEDINKLVESVSAVTKVMKEIESKISGDSVGSSEAMGAEAGGSFGRRSRHL